ncbi:hypothetical protein ACQKWADRAFT_327468 [Trichoderma austrokoningii]
MKGEELQKTVDLLSTYGLRGQDELQHRRPNRRSPCKKIDGLTEYAGYMCLCDGDNCDFVTRRLDTMHDHMPRHGKTASQHTEGSTPLWKACRLQTYFTAKGRIDYFTVNVVEQGKGRDAMLPSSSSSRLPPLPPPPLGQDAVHPALQRGLPPSPLEERLFDGLRGDLRQAGRDLDNNAAVVEDVGCDRADREPWLVHTGFPAHLRGIRDDEIKSSYQLPQKRDIFLSKRSTQKRDDEKPDQKDYSSRRSTRTHDGNGRNDTPGHGGPCARSEDSHEEEGEDDDDDLERLLAATEAFFRSAYRLVADRSPDRKITRQREQTLGDFAWGCGGNKGKDTPFRSFKTPSALTGYFTRMKELLVYYYRVVSAGCH